MSDKDEKKIDEFVRVNTRPRMNKILIHWNNKMQVALFIVCRMWTVCMEVIDSSGVHVLLFEVATQDIIK
jgi:hypothetical protein